MRWFKHDADASSDAKLKKLLIRHGAVGYAIYFHCLELIVSDLNETHVTFELEHDAEIIADNLKIKGNANESGIDIVNRVMKTILELGLFETDSNNRITCMKLLKRLDSSMTSNESMRAIIKSGKDNDGNELVKSCQSHDGVMMESCKTRRDKKRKDKKRTSVALERDGTHENLVSETTKTILTYLNERAGTAFRDGAGHRARISAALKKGYTLEDLKKIVAVKAMKWKDDPKMESFLRPGTLFAPAHMDDYLGEYETEAMKLKEGGE